MKILKPIMLLMLVVLTSPIVYASTDTVSWNTLIIAPHPDDETLGCAGVIMKELENGNSVGVVVLTNGDAYPRAASYVANKPIGKLTSEDYITLGKARQKWVEQSLSLIKFPRENLEFLSYPDGGLASLHSTNKTLNYIQTLTSKSTTYRTHLTDYHTRVHNKAADYTGISLLGDLVEILSKHQPKFIYVTNEADNHPDHKAAYWFVKEAVEKTNITTKIYTYISHSGEHTDWPQPRGVHLSSKFESKVVNNQRIPLGVDWPPHKRLQLTDQQSKTKLKMINQFEAEIALDADFMHSFAKSEEVFWEEK